MVTAIQDAATDGNHYATATEVEVEVAELIQRAVPGAERVRFANTGTEATMAAIRLARGYTGRPRFIKFEGHYHGWFDDFLVNAHPHHPVSLGHRNDPIKIADSSGINRRALDDTVVVPWNDLPALERALETWRGQIAAVITEETASSRAAGHEVLALDLGNLPIHYAFYTNGIYTIETKDVADLERHLDREERVWAVANAKRIDELSPEIRERMEIVATTHASRRDVALITNHPPPSSQ